MLTRFYILLLTLCLGLPAAASPLPFKISDETHTYWYYIQFDRNQGNHDNYEYLRHYPTDRISSPPHPRKSCSP